MRNLNPILLSISLIPMTSADWVELKYKKLASNQVTYSDSQIQIQVNSSASPLIHRMSKPILMEGFELKLRVEGSISNLKNNEFGEDSFLRLGLVATGLKTLNWLQKKIAADWVLQLFSMAPPGTGLDKIYFYNISPHSEQLGKSRIHPKSDLMQEQVVAIYSKNKEVLEVNHQFEKPFEVVALWLSSDGDDTKSQFQVTLEKIGLKIKDK